MFQEKADELVQLRAENADLRAGNAVLRAEGSELREQISLLSAELAEYKKRCDEYAAAYEQLKHQVRDLLRHRFGKKAERFVDDLPATDPDAPESKADDEEDEESPPKPPKKPRKTLKPLATRTVIIPVAEADRVCACGCQKTVVSYESKQIINYEPAVFEIIEQKREVMACPEGCDGAMVTAPAPLQVLPKSKASESLLAFLVVSKLEDRQPLYHLEKQLQARYDIDCSRQTMARWVIELVEPLRLFYNIMKDGAIDYDISSCDATTLQVLKEPGRKAETKSYVYCMLGGRPGQEVILYDYNDRLHKPFVQGWYAGYKGFLHCDGDNFFELLGDSEDVWLVNCNAHGRRKFEPIAKAAKGSGLAKEALRFYKALYKIERQAKEQGLNPEARYALRQKESIPILETFKQWLDKHISLVLPQSPLGKAIQYCLNRWEGLTRYCDDGRLEIDNNHNEREIKPFVMARKNFLFSSSVDGAYALCLHLSLIRTAKRHGLDPYHYYVKLLKNIPYCQSVEDYGRLLPWNLQADDLKAP